MAKLINQIEGHQDVISKLGDDLRNQKLPSCLLFTGPIGIGKKLVARALAQIANCEKKMPYACGECGSCIRIFKNESEAIFELKADGHQIKIDDARRAIQFFDLKNLNASRFLIVDDAELLNIQAANSLLKTFEEPPQNSFVILVTAYPWRLLATIQSRAVKINFQPLSLSSLRKITPDAPAWILNASYGQVGRAMDLISWNTLGLRDKAEKLLTFLKLPVDLSREELRSLIPSREQAPVLLRFLSSLVRDVIWWHESHCLDGIIHIDRMVWIQDFSSSYQKNLHALFKGLQDLESHILYNADVTLMFEKFFVERSHEPN
jgi:DNA polymerase-3 subunit delta'